MPVPKFGRLRSARADLALLPGVSISLHCHGPYHSTGSSRILAALCFIDDFGCGTRLVYQRTTLTRFGVFEYIGVSTTASVSIVRILTFEYLAITTRVGWISTTTSMVGNRIGQTIVLDNVSTMHYYRKFGTIVVVERR